MDLSKLTDEELLKLHQSNSNTSDLSKLSDAELLSMYNGGAKPQAIKSGPSKLESGVRGAAQGLTFGFADEATAALDSLVGKDSYDEALKKVRDLYANAQKENPLTYGASELGGGIATSFIPGLNVAKAGTLGKAALKSAASGALLGAGTNEGTLMDKLLAAGTGGTIGAGTGALGYGFSKGMEKMSGKLAKTATGATGREQQAFAKDSGNRLLSEKVVRFGDNAEDIAKRSKKMLTATGKEIGDSLDNIPPVPKDSVIEKLSAERAMLADKKANRLAVNKLDKEIAQFVDDPNPLISAKDLWEDKTLYANKVNWKPKIMRTASDSAGQKADLAVVNALTNAVEDTATAANPTLMEKFAKDRSLYALLSPVNKASARRAATQNAIPWGGLLDTSAAIGGIGYSMAKDDPSVGLNTAGAILGRRYVLPRLASSAAVTLGNKAIQNTAQRGISQGVPYMTNSIWKNFNNGE